MKGPILFILCLIYSPLGNVSFLNCANIMSPTSKFTSLLLKSTLCLYLWLLSCSFCFIYSCKSLIVAEKSSP